MSNPRNTKKTPLEILLQQQIGNRIATRRKTLNITQAELASKAEITPSHLSSIENGKSDTTISVLSRLAFHLSTTIDYLVYGTRVSSSLSDMEKQTIDDCNSEIGYDYAHILNSMNQLLVSLPREDAKRLCQYACRINEILTSFFKNEKP